MKTENKSFLHTLFAYAGGEKKKMLVGAPSVRKVPRGGSCISV